MMYKSKKVNLCKLFGTFQLTKASSIVIIFYILFEFIDLLKVCNICFACNICFYLLCNRGCAMPPKMILWLTYYVEGFCAYVGGNLSTMC
jgi:hypothetical protein